MTLPEKVRDVTQSEWLEVRERLAAAEAQAERWRQDAGAAHGRYSDALSALKRVEGERDEARERAQEAECEVQSWKDECGRWEERVGEVEARLLAVTSERDEAQRGRTSVAAVNAALRDYPDADVSALWVPASEALEYQACWHRDVAKGRAALEKAEAERDAMRKERDEAGRDWEREHDRAAAREEQIEEAHAHTGCEREWTNLHDLGDCLARSVAEMAADLAAARAQLAAVVAAGREVIAWWDDPRSQGDLGPILRNVLADAAQAAREHDERVRAEVLRDAAEKGRNDAGWPGFDRVRPDVAAMRLAYECLRAGPLSMRVFQALECGGRGSEAVALGETALAWGDGKVRGRRMLRARLALFIRARLRAEAGDYGPLYCTCFDEPRAVATHRDARYCRKPHPMRITPLWEQAAQWWTTHERPGGGR